ncbi:MAG: hypothetical protein VYD90_10230 [Pseudomonadota bacterium]|nr:hypothetical protein [Pseudomonadota bacterium]
MQGAESAIKTIPPLAVALVAQVFDPLWLIIIPAGLLIGTLAQAGRMVKANRTWNEIKHELLVSALVGGANALLASLVIWTMGLNYLQGLVAATLCAFGGVATIERAFEWMWKNFTRDAARLGHGREED